MARSSRPALLVGLYLVVAFMFITLAGTQDARMQVPILPIFYPTGDVVVIHREPGSNECNGLLIQFRQYDITHALAQPEFDFTDPLLAFHVSIEKKSGGAPPVTSLFYPGSSLELTTVPPFEGEQEITLLLLHGEQALGMAALKVIVRVREGLNVDKSPPISRYDETLLQFYQDTPDYVLWRGFSYAVPVFHAPPDRHADRRDVRFVYIHFRPGDTLHSVLHSVRAREHLPLPAIEDIVQAVRTALKKEALDSFDPSYLSFESLGEYLRPEIVGNSVSNRALTLNMAFATIVKYDFALDVDFPVWTLPVLPEHSAEDRAALVVSSERVVHVRFFFRQGQRLMYPILKLSHVLGVAVSSDDLVAFAGQLSATFLVQSHANCNEGVGHSWGSHYASRWAQFDMSFKQLLGKADRRAIIAKLTQGDMGVKNQFPVTTFGEQGRTINMNLKEYWKQLYQPILDVLTPDTTHVLDMGSGFGRVLAWIFDEGAPREATYFALDLVKQGHDMTTQLASMQPAYDVVPVPFDLAAPGEAWLDRVKGVHSSSPPGRVVVFSSASFCMVRRTEREIFAQVLSLADDVVGVHLELISHQFVEETESRVYEFPVAHPGVPNRDFLVVVRQLEAEGLITVHRSVPRLIGTSATEPSGIYSLVVWQKAGSPHTL